MLAYSLQRQPEEPKDIPWPDLMRDLREVRAVEATVDDHRYRIRTELRGHAAEAFTAAGVRPPRVCEALTRCSA